LCGTAPRHKGDHEQRENGSLSAHPAPIGGGWTMCKGNWRYKEGMET